MRLIQCHIENFGKLHDVTLDFNEGINAFCQENGWGKSTLGAFIRVMLYGFEGENKRESERKRYEPWQGGIYGGSITFETKGKTYVAQRVFRKKAAEDSFELRDAVTNIESKDYSSNLGEELFKINSESFLRTAFINQMDCVTNTTDSINAKIGNLTDNTNDLNRFEVADEALKDLLNKLSPRRKTGTLNQLQSEVTALKKKVADGSGLEQSLDSYNDYYEKDKRNLEEVLAQRDALALEQEEASKYQAAKSKLDMYEHLQEEVTRLAKEFEGKKSIFPKEIPSEEAIKDAINALSEMEKSSKDKEFYEMSAQDKERYHVLRELFAEGLPAEEEDKVAKIHANKDEKQKEIYRLQKQWNERITKKATLALKQENLKNLQDASDKQKASQKRTGLVFFGVAIVCLLAGVGLFLIVADKIFIGLGIVAFGLPFVVAGIVKLSKAKTFEDEKILSLEEEILEEMKEVDAIDEEIRNYLEKQDVIFEEDGVAESLQKLLDRSVEEEREALKAIDESAENVRLLTMLKQKESAYEQAEKTYNEYRFAVMNFLQKYGFVPMEDALLRNQLQQILEDILAIAPVQAEVLQAQEKARAYEEEHHIKDLKENMPERPFVGAMILNEQVRQYEDAWKSINVRLDQYRQQMEVLQEQVDEWNATKEELAEKEEQLEKQLMQYSQLEKTKDLLTKAKESLTARYMGPIMKHFLHYYEVITKQEASAYRMDANTNITVEEQGLQRDIKFLSVGYQDLVGVCLRLALVGAMYPDEKPVLVLDDPFVNLDAEKLEGAKKLLDELEKEYQVIYFTCRNS